MTPVDESKLTAAEGTELVVFAKNQPEYLPLPARRYPDGKVFHEWTLNKAETEALLDSLLDGRPLTLRIWQYTHNQPLQPVRPELI